MKQLILCLALLYPILTSCQSITIKGSVINEEGTPVAGATITIKQSGKSTVADSKGIFILTGTRLSDTLLITGIGYQTATVPNNGRGLISITLKKSNAVPPAAPLAPGDTIPPVILTDVINFPLTEISFHSLKNKLIILDFWATWCNSCVKGFNKLDSLSTTFRGLLFPILVNSTITTADKEQGIKNYLLKRKLSTGKSISLPVYIDTGTVFKQWFPHLFLPHYVWLYNNRVVAITSSAELTKENIQSVLNGSPNPMKQKTDNRDQQITYKVSHKAFFPSPNRGLSEGGQKTDFPTPN